MAVFNRILVAFDGSQACRNAAQKAVSIAADQGATLIGLKVVAFEGETIAPSDRLWSTIIDDLQQKARAVLGDLESLAKECGMEIALEVRVGYVEEEIVRVTSRHEADLIVIGVGDKPGMHRLSLRRLVREAPCPVLMTQ